MNVKGINIWVFEQAADPRTKALARDYSRCKQVTPLFRLQETLCEEGFNRAEKSTLCRELYLLDMLIGAYQWASNHDVPKRQRHIADDLREGTAKNLPDFPIGLIA